ncbi:hypothetical protein GGS21DRAFT_511241 [Xylaria nigripes]|nr:hypothetical protein GGS21DRAFT_511241 [Xylaria nigripes]
MNRSSLLAPGVGRSRFSKALPRPPSELDDKPRGLFRKLPDVPSAPPPPKKNSVLIGSISTPSLRRKALDSPLPIVPFMDEPVRIRARAGPIPRKPVPQSSTRSASVGANMGAEPKPHELKREASISSLLSAYSHSSSERALKSSHESDSTKDSEPSYSPEREEMIHNIPPIPSKKSMEAESIYSDGISEVISYRIIDSFPPPPPLTTSSQVHTPSDAGLMEGAQGREGESVSRSPISISDGYPREIWRRRASSKSDASLVIADLKLPDSNGSTAPTPGGRTEPPSLPPLLPSLSPFLPDAPNYETALPLPDNPPQQPPLILPPSNVSIHGKNVQPIVPAEPPIDEEMKKLLKLSKIKEIVHRKGDDGGDESEEQSQKEKEENKPQESRSGITVKKYDETEKVESATKEETTHQQLQQPQHASPNVTLANPDAPPKESGESFGTVGVISRNPIGELPALDFSHSKLEFLGGALERIPEHGPMPRDSSISRPPSTTMAGSLQLRQTQQSSRQQFPPRVSSAYSPHTPAGPVSQTEGSDNMPLCTFTRPGQPPAPSMPTPSTTARTTSLNYQAPGSRSVSSGINEHPKRFIPPPPPSAAGFTLPFLPRPVTPGRLREDVARESEQYRELASGPMSAEAAAAVALFPREQQWKTECTMDGVWPPNPLTSQHHNCHARHYKLVPARNTNYPLACQACGIADSSRRLSCPCCNLRICPPCAEILIANGRDLSATMAVLRDQGKIREWNLYPKRDDNQNA